MKKIITISVAFVLCASVSAEKLQILKCSEDGIPGVTEPQLLGLGISSDGKYVCGTIEQASGIFIANCQTGEVKYKVPEGGEGAELRNVDNEGFGVGYADSGITYSFATDEMNAFVVPEGIKFLLAEDLTDDGATIVGSYIVSGYSTLGAYLRNGSWSQLPLPTDAELGGYVDKVRMESSAKFISGDGKVILGNLGGIALPLLWKADDNGGYEVDFFPERFVKTKDEDLNDDEKVPSSISGMHICLSNNGRYVAMTGLYRNPVSQMAMSIPVVYDTETKEIKLYDEIQEVDEMGLGLFPTAIADDGTFIGTIGDPYATAGAFIMKAGQTQAETFLNAFPEFYEVLGESDLYGFNTPQGITADGSKIVGQTFYSDDYFEGDSPAYWVTYVIDLGNDTAVGELSASSCQESIFSIDGRPIDRMTKGLNIVRKSDGSVLKILKK